MTSYGPTPVRLKNSVKFKHVTFGYQMERSVFKRTSLMVNVEVLHTATEGQANGILRPVRGFKGYSCLMPFRLGYECRSRCFFSAEPMVAGALDGLAVRDPQCLKISNMQ